MYHSTPTSMIVHSLHTVTCYVSVIWCSPSLSVTTVLFFSIMDRLCDIFFAELTSDHCVLSLIFCIFAVGASRFHTGCNAQTCTPTPWLWACTMLALIECTFDITVSSFSTNISFHLSCILLMYTKPNMQ